LPSRSDVVQVRIPGACGNKHREVRDFDRHTASMFHYRPDHVRAPAAAAQTRARSSTGGHGAHIERLASSRYARRHCARECTRSKRDPRLQQRRS
jgi:hypothetical protein